MDKTLKLTDDQRIDVRNNLRNDADISDAVRRLYRSVYVPIREGFKQGDIGIPTYGEDKSIDQAVFDKLRTEEEILEKISPIVIKERYLENNDHLKVRQIYDSMVRTPGESRVISPDIVEAAIKRGVKEGKFGLGEMDNSGKITCRFFQDDITMSIDEMDLLVSGRLCSSQTQSDTIGIQEQPSNERKTGELLIQTAVTSDTKAKIMKEVTLRFKVPSGQVSQLYGTMHFLQTKFRSLEIEVKATNGYISEDDYVNKIKETLLQLGIDLKDQ